MFKYIGGIIGFFMGGVFGLFGMIIGAVIGSQAGRSIDNLLFGERRNYRNPEAEEAYRRFYQQFYQNRSYANNGSYDYSSVSQGASDSCYSDIGCSRTDSNETIKKQYRKLVSQYHPDRIASKGLSESEMKEAEARFKKIQESYNLIKKEKGI